MRGRRGLRRAQWGDAQWGRLGAAFGGGSGRANGGTSGGMNISGSLSRRTNSLIFAAPLVALMACLAVLNTEERSFRGLQQEVALAIEPEGEESSMRTTTGVGLVGAAVSIGGAHAQYADFARPTDTVQLTHNVPTTSVITIEARVWIDTVSDSWGLGKALWREQKNAQEHKSVDVCSRGVWLYLAPVVDVRWEGAFPLGGWVHVACQQANGIAQIWVDGVLKQVVNSSFNTILGVPTSSNSIGAGLQNDSSVVTGAQCKIDWLRVSTCARYSGTTFSPPDECDLIPADSCTALLFTFDEPASSGTLVNRGSLSGTATIGAAWIAGATSPTLGGMSVDTNGNGIPDACEVPPCLADIDDSGFADAIDLAIVLANWGAPSPKYPEADVNGDGDVNGVDLAEVLSNWGACP